MKKLTPFILIPAGVYLALAAGNYLTQTVDGGKHDLKKALLSPLYTLGLLKRPALTVTTATPPAAIIPATVPPDAHPTTLLTPTVPTLPAGFGTPL